ncbi:MAG TPA: hypothetical protein PLR01_13885, partial [Bacteroidales bacterium]|nr:hypothetical protein [Bacteroidales bacterium]
MARFTIIFLLLCLTGQAFSQINPADSILQTYTSLPDDSTKVNTLISVAGKYVRIDPTVTILVSSEALRIAEQIRYQKGIGYALKNIGM